MDDIAYKIAVEMFGKETADRMRAEKKATTSAPSAEFTPKAGGTAIRSPTGSIPANGGTLVNGIPQLPPHIAAFMGPHGALNDSLSGEPVGWGWPVIGRMGEELWNEAQGYGQMVYDHGAWYLIHRVLTREEAIKKYGPITNEEYGPRGGWRSVTFGSTMFKHKCLKPQK
jgi:hypothetical protein